MRTIKQADIILSIYNSLQFISYCHPIDFLKALTHAYTTEESKPAKSALKQLLINSKMAAADKRPICQDTGIVIVFVEIGRDCNIEGELSLEDMINEGVRLAYTDEHNPLRASMVNNPHTTRINTKDNTPAVIHYKLVEGDNIAFNVAAKGGGSENKAKFEILMPSDSVEDWVIKTVSKLGAGWCPPGIISIGIGGSPEKSMLMAKEGMLHDIDMQELLKKGPETPDEELRIKLYYAINNLGIGAQGLGGINTVFDVKVNSYPCHVASLPVSLIPNCGATRHTHFILDGRGPAIFKEIDLSNWLDLDDNDSSKFTKVDLDNLKPSDTNNWKVGQILLLSGVVYTARDAAHKKLVDLIDNNQKLPADLTNKFIYYVGPVKAVRDEIIGPAGPTTAFRMDKFLEKILPATNIIGMIGKAERGEIGEHQIAKHGAIYLIATGGAGYLISKSIKKSELIAFPELGTEAIYKINVENMPVTVAIDRTGASIHKQGRLKWVGKFKNINIMSNTLL